MPTANENIPLSFFKHQYRARRTCPPRPAKPKFTLHPYTQPCNKARETGNNTKWARTQVLKMTS